MTKTISDFLIGLAICFLIIGNLILFLTNNFNIFEFYLILILCLIGLTITGKEMSINRNLKCSHMYIDKQPDGSRGYFCELGDDECPFQDPLNCSSYEERTREKEGKD